jgi:hypothetical protein
MLSPNVLATSWYCVPVEAPVCRDVASQALRRPGSGGAAFDAEGRRTNSVGNPGTKLRFAEVYISQRKSMLSVNT